MSNMNRQSIRKMRKRKRRKRMFLFIFLPILIAGIGLAGYGTSLFLKAGSMLDSVYKPLDRDSSRTAANPDVDNVSVLIMGVDDSSTRGFDSAARTDALLVATFNKKANSIKLLSIPRDSYVHIPEVGYKDKITHAHVHGGPKSTIETVEGLLDVPIDYYVKVNFDAFIEIVDALGGVEMYVPITFTEQDSNDQAGAISLEEGYQRLNGEEALALARTRKIDNDFERGKRQQEILKAMIKKTLSVGSITKYSDVIDAIGNNMETDVATENALSFADYLKNGSSLNIESLTLEGDDLWIPNNSGQNIYYFGLNETRLEEVKSTLKSHLELGTTNLGQSSDSFYQDQAQGEY